MSVCPPPSASAFSRIRLHSVILSHTRALLGGVREPRALPSGQGDSVYCLQMTQRTYPHTARGQLIAAVVGHLPTDPRGL